MSKYEELIEKSLLCRKAASEAACEWMRRFWLATAQKLIEAANDMPIHIAELPA